MNENELTGLLESLRRMGSDDLNVEVKESATTLSRDVWGNGQRFRKHRRRHHRTRSERARGFCPSCKL